MIESATLVLLLPATRLDGVNAALAPEGRLEAENETVSPSVPFIAVSDKLKFAIWPAVMVWLEEGAVTLKSATGLLTVNDTTTDGFPPGFATVTSGVPATAMALAGMAACNSVGF